VIRALAFALSLTGFVLPALWLRAAASDASPLQRGQALPQISGPALTGRSIELPAAANGKPAVVIFSFSKAAGNDARSWNERLSRDFPGDAPSFTIIVLESVPKLFRGMALSGIKSSMPSSVQDRTIVLYRDEMLWKQRLAFSEDSRAYVLLLGSDGRIQWKNEGPFKEDAYAQLKDQLTRMLRSHS
jgi:ATP10 protein